MKLLTDLQNPDALKCLITSLVTGVKLEVTPVDLKGFYKPKLRKKNLHFSK